MFGFIITRDKEIKDAIKLSSELSSVFNSLKMDLSDAYKVNELCKSYCVSGFTARRLGICRGSKLSAILDLYYRLRSEQDCLTK